MVPADIKDYVERLKTRFSELEKKLGDPDIYSKVNEFKALNQEHRKLSTLFTDFDAWVKALTDLEDSRELMAAENDPEMRELAELDLAALRDEVMLLENKVRQALLPPDEND